MKIIRYSLFAVLALFLLVGTSCQKNPSNTTTSEDALAVTTSPASTNNHVEAPALGPTFPLAVTITSKMPSGGVSITVVAHPDGNATNFYSETKNSSAAANTFTITNTPQTVVCVTEITVTSRSSASNKWTGSYRYSRK